jgi:hypothetical protein
MEPVTAMLLLGGSNMAMGAMKAQQAAKQRQQEANIRAAEIEASPWTGKGPSTQVTTQTLNPWAEMAGGAVNTLGQAAALKSAGLFDSGTGGATDGISKMAENTKVMGSGADMQFASMSPYEKMYKMQNQSYNFQDPFGLKK